MLLILPTVGMRAQTAPQITTLQHMQRAQGFLAQKRPADAIPEFRAVLAAEPENADAAANLGVLLYFAGDYAGSAPLLKQTVARQPLPKLQALLGLCERRNGEPEQARHDLEAALPGLQEAAIRRQAGLELIELDTAAGDLPAAASVVSQLKASAPDDPAILYTAYRIYTDLAGEAMLDLSLAAPQSGQMHQAMAHELQRERDSKAAILNYRVAIAADPSLPGVHYELAEALRLSAEPALKAEAAGEYRLAMKENPHDAKSLTRLADLTAEAGDHEKAVTQYREALRYTPGDNDASIGLAHELVETGKLAEALAILQAIEKLDPTDVLIHFRLSALYRRMGKPDAAQREVAEYERYKAIKDKMRALYQEMRLDAPGSGMAQQ